jgi:uncharacterized protein YwgA
MPDRPPLHIDNRKDFLLLLLAAHGGQEDAEPVVGVTRLQKYLFLLQQEHDWNGRFHVSDPYEFEAYDYGPFDAQLYDDLVMLENAGLIDTSSAGPEPSAENNESRRRDFDWATVDRELAPWESEDQIQRYALTDRGRKFASRYELSAEDEAVLADLKGTWNQRPLQALLRWLYHNYPEWATNTRLPHLRA